MKYLITDTEAHTLGEINEYFAEELKKTDLNKGNIVVSETLKVKLAMMELQRIFDENGMAELYEIDLGVIHLKHTGNIIAFSNDELMSRFEDAYESILGGCSLLKKYVIINGASVHIIEKESMAAAKDAAIAISNHSEELIVREIL